MAKEPSFDVVSEVDMQEVSNAVNQTVKEITQRFDFKGRYITSRSKPSPKPACRVPPYLRKSKYHQ